MTLPLPNHIIHSLLKERVLILDGATGTMIQRFCPAEGDKSPEQMWLYFAVIAMMSTVILLLAKNWVGKDFKTKA